MQDLPNTTSQALETRDRFMRRKNEAMDPSERLLAMQELLAQSRFILEQNPEANQHFLKRNFRARSIGHALHQARHDA